MGRLADTNAFAVLVGIILATSACGGSGPDESLDSESGAAATTSADEPPGGAEGTAAEPTSGSRGTSSSGPAPTGGATDATSSAGTSPGENSSSGPEGSSGREPPPTLDPEAPPADNFDLEHWKLTLPDASEISQQELEAGFEDESFQTDPDTGGMVFNCPNHGGTTSGSTSYSRSELREMLREPGEDVSTQGINGNNWVTSTSSPESRDAAGGVDGRLDATLTVDHVSTTADEQSRVGRVIVGQIHAPDDEPCKLYFRKLPANERGSVYFAYEPLDGDDVIIPLIGSPDSDAESPADGIALGEMWDYSIEVTGHALEVSVTTAAGATVSETYEMTDDYDDAYLYFKAGVYNQNDGGDEGDYVQATFYALTHTHD